MLKALFIWFDAHPATYWGLALAPTLLLVGWLWAGWRGHRWAALGRGTDARVALLFLAVLLAWRWPAFFDPNPLNPDEAQFIAGALTLERDPVPFRSLDIATVGPVNPWALRPTHWLGLPQDYFNARLTAALLLWGTLGALYALVRTAFPPVVAVMGLLPTLFLLTTAGESGFDNYSSEHLPLLLGWVGAWLIYRGRPRAEAPVAHGTLSWLAAGLCIGLLPWTKLQTAPLAATFALWGAFLALTDVRSPWIGRLRRVGWLAGATLLPSVLLGLLLLATDQCDQFWTGYIVSNLHYVDIGKPLSEVIATLARETAQTGIFPTYLFGAVLTVGVAAISAWRHRLRPGPLGWGATLFLGAGLVAVLTPHRAFTHYLLFLIPPLAFATALAFGTAYRAVSGARGRLALGLVFGLLGAGGQLAVRAHTGVPPIFGRFGEYWRHPYEAVARQIRALQRPGDCLATWGWWSHIHVETGLPQATRDGHCERQISPSPLRDTFYRPRYLADLQRSRPAFFVDAVGPGSFAFNSRSVDGHEAFPPLRDHIRDHYVLVEDHGYARLYMRASLADERHYGVPVVAPITLKHMIRKTATGEVTLFDGAKEVVRKDGPHTSMAPGNPGVFDGECLFAHAPSTLAHAVPSGSTTVRGGFGFLPGAYADPASCTDGATFAVDAILVDGSRQRLLERRLAPAEQLAERAPVDFSLPLPRETREIEFLIAAGATASFDWTFWRNLRFELPWEMRPPAP